MKPASIPPPLAMIAELTHRCPLQCPYCSNPLELLKVGQERDTQFWKNLISEAAELGVLQLHLSGGEPAVRTDLVALIDHASASGIYTNLITSGVLLDAPMVTRLAAAGLGHVQISFQGASAESADTIGKYRNGHAKKTGGGKAGDGNADVADHQRRHAPAESARTT